MSLADDQNALLCNCLAIRQASRHVTQFYDQLLAPSGLRTTQFAILGRLQRSGPMPINALAAALVMDRTTLGTQHPAAGTRRAYRDRRLTQGPAAT